MRLYEGQKIMSNKIGRFEILSELAHSDRSSVYKATDTEGGQTVALKAIALEAFGEQTAAVVESVHEEAAASKVLASHNIALLNSVEEIEGKLCASMEYVQGNSVATMLARKEGFSIWDLQDIARQACQGLDHAHVRKVVHCSLEPAKIMVQWDGIVKLLGFGMSRSGMGAAQAAGHAPEILHYMSPEQLRGDPIDARSNLFSLGAILYEMVTERKAFEGDDAEQVRKCDSRTDAGGGGPGEPQDPSRAEPGNHESAGEVAGGAVSVRAGSGERSGEVQGQSGESGGGEAGGSGGAEGGSGGRGGGSA